MNAFTKRLKVKLQRLREAKGLTQMELAKKARVTQPLISQLEAGTKPTPSVVHILRIAKALGVTVEELVK